MPTYVYKFVDTGETIEVQQSFQDDTLSEFTHPDSGAVMPVKKVFQPVGVTFKGSGFFKNDNRGKSSSTTPSGSASSGDSSSSSDSASTSSSSDSSSKVSSDSGSSVSSSESTPKKSAPKASVSSSVD